MTAASTKEIILARLQALGVPFTLFEHAAANTIADCLTLPCAEADVTFCKNILLCNRQQTAFYLYVTPPEKPFRTADTSKALGVSRLSFAPANCLVEMLHLHSGSLSPLGLWFDESRKITLVFDRDIRTGGRIAFHPCDNTATVVFTQKDFFTRIVPTLHHDPVWI